jgi:hypothetical protein
MEQLVPFDVGGHGTVLIAVASVASADVGTPTLRGLERGSVEKVAESAGRSLRSAVERVIPAAHDVLDMVERSSSRPDEVSVCFGIGLTASADAFIASASSNASFTVTLTWKRPPQAQSSATGPG